MRSRRFWSTSRQKRSKIPKQNRTL